MILAALKSNIDLRFFSLFPIKKEPAVIINTNATRETVKSIEFEIEKPTARASALTAIEIKKNLRTGKDLFSDWDSAFSNIEFKPK